MEAPSVPAETVKAIITNSALNPAAIIKKLIPAPPPLPTPPGKEYPAELIAKAITTGIPKENHSK